MNNQTNKIKKKIYNHYNRNNRNNINHNKKKIKMNN